MVDQEARIAELEQRVAGLEAGRDQLLRLLELVGALLGDEALRSRAEEATAVR